MDGLKGMGGALIILGLMLRILAMTATTLVPSHDAEIPIATFGGSMTDLLNSGLLTWGSEGIAGLGLLLMIGGTVLTPGAWEAATPQATATQVKIEPSAKQAIAKPEKPDRVAALPPGIGESIERIERFAAAISGTHEGESSGTSLLLFTARRTISDYLPKTVEAYFAVPEQARTQADEDRLAEQIETIEEGLKQVLRGSADEERIAFAANGRFLGAKFPKS